MTNDTELSAVTEAEILGNTCVHSNELPFPVWGAALRAMEILNSSGGNGEGSQSDVDNKWPLTLDNE